MLYSNEVFLIDTSRARYTSQDSFSEIDLGDISTYEGNTLDRESYNSIRSRLFKIIDVKFYNEHNLSMQCFPVGILLQPIYYMEDMRNVICRASDLLYMHDTLISLSYIHVDNSTSVQYYTMEEGKLHNYRDANEVVNYICSNSIYRSNRQTNIHKSLMEATLVDRKDFRLSRVMGYNGRRAYLHKFNSRVLRDIIECQPRRVELYKECSDCSSIHLELDLKIYGDLPICKSCYTTKTTECGVCYAKEHISNVNHIDSARGVEKYMLEMVDADCCCSSCHGMFYHNCVRCKKVELIDLTVLRNTQELSKKSAMLHSFKYDNNEYSRILDRMYCSSCGTARLNAYLFNPFRGVSLPEVYPDKTEFNRFVGIESEVITEYSDADNYYDEGLMPKHFKVVNDGSLNENGVEFVTSRPLIGNQIYEALDSLEEANIAEYNEVDNSCGVHIHLNAIDFGFKELKSLLMIMTRIQKPIYESLPKFREKDYCREILLSPSEWASINDLPTLVSSYYNLQDSIINDNKYNEARYTGTNIHARFFLGSVEFRYHEGSIKSKPIENWIRFLNKIMDVSRKLHNKPKLYNKIISTKIQPIDIIREVTGVWGAEYIERKIDNKNNV